MAYFSFKSIEEKPHHLKNEISGTRARYRDGRRDTAVKVYTVSQESNYLLIVGVPAVGASDELKSLCEQYGEVEIHHLDEYQCEDFTEAYLAKYTWFPAARTAKRHLDDKQFFGGILHVCYAPEYETVQETSEKLQERRKYVSTQLRKGTCNNTSGLDIISNALVTQQELLTRSNQPVSSFKAHQDEKKDQFTESHQPVTYIWAGKEYTIYPQSISAGNVSEGDAQSEQKPKMTVESFIPRQLARGQEAGTKQNHRVSRATAEPFSKRQKIQ